MIFIVLPAFNEEGTVGVVCRKLTKVLKKTEIPYQIVIVNDGSTDNTLKIVQKLRKKTNFEVINHRQNKGLGEAIKSGFIKVLKKANPQDIVITLDADNTHPAELIPVMVKKIKSGTDLVIASRYQKGAVVFGVPAFRLLLSNLSSLIFKLFFPIPGIRDYTSGFRAYRTQVLKKAFSIYGENFISQSGFSVMVDILLKLRKIGSKATEVPLTLHYQRKVGGSKMRVVTTVWETLQLLLKRRLGYYS